MKRLIYIFLIASLLVGVACASNAVTYYPTGGNLTISNYFNASNFTSTQNTATFYNAINVTSNSNTTIFYNATFGNSSPAINESYAYLPGRDGGQTLTGGTTTGNLVLNGSTAGGDVYIQPNGGNIGFGTASPINTFNFVSSVTSSRLNLTNIGQSSSNGIVMWSNITSGTGTMSTISWLNPPLSNVRGSIAVAGQGAYQSAMIFSVNGTRRATIFNTGNIGIGNYYTPSSGATYPTAQLDTTGSVRFRNCSGTPTFDTGGNLTCASDPKLKTAVTTYTSDSAKVAAIVPISYKWNTASGYDTTHTNTGFDAQQIAQVYPECIIARDDVIYSQVCDKEENCETVEKKIGTQTLSIDDKCLIAVLFNAAKDQQKTITSLETRITALEKGTVKP
jgi:hypothetical protein